MENFPTGMRFQPSEKEKIDYLLYKVNRKPLRCDDFISINTVDIYSDEEPWEIFKDPEDHENYFFTRLKVVKHTGKYGKRFGRVVGKGMWQMYSYEVSISDSKKEEIDFLKRFQYKNKKNADQDGKWFLEQYTLADKFKCCVKDEYIDYTFCWVYKYHEGSDQEKRSLDIDRFFDQMLEENSKTFPVNLPQTSMVPENTGSGILQSNDLSDSSPYLDLDLSLKR
ncbi:hypothetical protein Pfo_020517 [Paulownia fortunei]|nr:hypothetical protein Pfo_020517 [Paulownia fortunei]